MVTLSNIGEGSCFVCIGDICINIIKSVVSSCRAKKVLIKFGKCCTEIEVEIKSNAKSSIWVHRLQLTNSRIEFFQRYLNLSIWGTDTEAIMIIQGQLKRSAVLGRAPGQELRNSVIYCKVLPKTLMDGSTIIEPEYQGYLLLLFNVLCFHEP